MFSSKKKTPRNRDPPDAALLSALSVLYAFIDEHAVPWLYRDCADHKTQKQIVKSLQKGTLARDLETRKIVLEAKAAAVAVVDCLKSRAPLTSYGLYDSFLDAATPPQLQEHIAKLDNVAQRGLGDLCAHLSKVWDRNGTVGLTLQQLSYVVAPVLLRRDEGKPSRDDSIKRQKCAAQLLTLPWASPRKREIVTRARGHWSSVKAARRAAHTSNPVARRSLKVTWKKGAGPTSDALLAAPFAQYGNVARSGLSARNSGVVLFDDAANRDAAFSGYAGPWVVRKADAPKAPRTPLAKVDEDVGESLPASPAAAALRAAARRDPELSWPAPRRFDEAAPVPAPAAPAPAPVPAPSAPPAPAPAPSAPPALDAPSRAEAPAARAAPEKAPALPPRKPAPLLTPRTTVKKRTAARADVELRTLKVGWPEFAPRPSDADLKRTFSEFGLVLNCGVGTKKRSGLVVFGSAADCDCAARGYRGPLLVERLGAPPKAPPRPKTPLRPRTPVAAYDPACLRKVSWRRDAPRPTEALLRATFGRIAPVVNVGIGGGSAALVVFRDAAGARAAEASYAGPLRVAAGPGRASPPPRPRSPRPAPVLLAAPVVEPAVARGAPVDDAVASAAAHHKRTAKARPAADAAPAPAVEGPAPAAATPSRAAPPDRAPPSPPPTDTEPAPLPRGVHARVATRLGAHRTAQDAALRDEAAAWRARALEAEAALTRPPPDSPDGATFASRAQTIGEEVRASIENAMRDDRPRPLAFPEAPPSLEGGGDDAASAASPELVASPVAFAPAPSALVLAPFAAPPSPWRRAAREAREELDLGTQVADEADDAFAELMKRQTALASKLEGNLERIREGLDEFRGTGSVETALVAPTWREQLVAPQPRYAYARPRGPFRPLAPAFEPTHPALQQWWAGVCSQRAY